jgi:pimeloyl-ACP methyl ester carboxylesterase
MDYVTVDRYSLRYVDQGVGETVVLIHGSASDLRTWSRLQAALSESYRVIAYSRRYHWPNQKISDAADYSMPEHVDDLEGLLRHLDAVPVHLVGHSYGGFLALLLAIRAPYLVRSLVLSEPPVVSLYLSNPPRLTELGKLLLFRPRTAVPILMFLFKGVLPAKAAAERGDMDAVMRVFGTAVLGAPAFHRMGPERRSQVRDNLMKAEFTGSGFAPLDPEEVQALKVPTLLLNSQNGPRMFARLLDRLEELIPNVRRAEIPDASHIMHEDNERAFTDALLAHLAANSVHRSR